MRLGTCQYGKLTEIQGYDSLHSENMLPAGSDDAVYQAARTRVDKHGLEDAKEGKNGKRRGCVNRLILS